MAQKEGKEIPYCKITFKKKKQDNYFTQLLCKNHFERFWQDITELSTYKIFTCT